MPFVLSAENLGVKADGSADSWRIRHIDLQINPGTFIGLIGGSGAGKSTLLRALSIHLLKKGDEGALFFHHPGGRSLVDENTQDTYLERFAFVPQEDHFAEALTVAETLRLAGAFAGSSHRPSALLRDVGLPDETLDKPVRVLSGGQKRRLSVARALISNPEIIFLDEPTSGLDLPLAQEIMGTLAGLCRSAGITVICTSHLPSTLKNCDRVLVMSPGEDGAGGTITADYDGAAFCTALESDPDATALYQDKTTPASISDRDVQSEAEADVEMPPPAVAHRFSAQFRAVFGRSQKAWRRDRSNLLIFTLQPVALAFIVVVTQALHEENAGLFVDFFLTVAALWIGISLCIRDFVSERVLYALDELSGLGPPAYFWAKLTFASSLTLGGILILCVAAHAFVAAADAAFDLEHARVQFTLWHFMPRLIILGVTGLSGTMIGLLLSLMARSERAAISFMPLALLPQVVFSAFACGYATRQDREHLFPFHALLQRSGESGSFLDWANYLAGLMMSTRHANWSLDSLTADGFEWSKFHWADFGALWVVLAVLAGLVCLAFFATANRAILRIR